MKTPQNDGKTFPKRKLWDEYEEGESINFP